MLERTLILSSKIAKQKDSSSRAENFTVRLDTTLHLPRDKQYKIALHKLQSTYSWHNIEASYGNNLIRYSIDAGVSWKNITFDDGIYSYEDINDFIQSKMKLNGDYTEVLGVITYDIDISFNISTFRVVIALTNSYQIDLTSFKFSDLIGFNADIITTTQSSPRLPDITQSRDNIYVHCSLCSDSIVDGKYSDVIYTYSTATLSRSYSYDFQDYNLVFNKMNSLSIDSITMRTTDVTNKEIDFNGVDVLYAILIREDV